MDLVRFGVYWANLDPSIGYEIKKTRPVVIVSPKEMNDHLKTVLVCPLTSTQKNYPSRIRVSVNGRKGDVVIDQLRAIDHSRIMQQIALLSDRESKALVERIIEVFRI